MHGVHAIRRTDRYITVSRIANMRVLKEFQVVQKFQQYRYNEVYISRIPQ